MKYAFIKDFHTMLGLDKPLSRTDSFQDDMIEKYTSLRDKLREREIKTIIFTGDIFQVKAPSKYDINAIGKLDWLFLDLLGEFDKYTIRGNHDMFKTANGEHKNSIFEIGITHKWYKTLEGTPLITEDIAIYGLDFRESVEELKAEIEILSKQAVKQSFDGKKTCIVVHEHLVPNIKDMFLKSYILYDWFTDKDFDIVVGGHLHKGYATQEIDGVTFINPWSFVRLAREHYTVDDKHKPCFSYIDIENSEIIETKTIAVKYKKYSEAFTTTVISESALINNISDFKAKIAAAGSVGKLDMELLKNVSESLDERESSLVPKAINYIESLIKGS